MTLRRVLCLFSSAALRDRSFFARDDGGWTADLDEGRCEFVALVVDEDVATVATSGLFAAASLVCRSVDLSPAFAAALRPAARAFSRARVPLELLPSDGPVSTLEWFAANVPELARLCRIDAELRIDTPEWWRDRARWLFAEETMAAVPSAVPQDLAPELRAFVSRRGW